MGHSHIQWGGDTRIVPGGGRRELPATRMNRMAAVKMLKLERGLDQVATPLRGELGLEKGPRSALAQTFG